MLTRAQLLRLLSADLASARATLLPTALFQSAILQETSRTARARKSRTDSLPLLRLWTRAQSLRLPRTRASLQLPQTWRTASSAGKNISLTRQSTKSAFTTQKVLRILKFRFSSDLTSRTGLKCSRFQTTFC